MNRPCSTEKETFHFDLATKLKTHSCSKEPSFKKDKKTNEAKCWLEAFVESRLLFWMRGSGTSQGSRGRMASFSSFRFRRSRHFCQTARPSTLSPGNAFRVPELKGGSEASDGDQADIVSNEASYWEMAKVAPSCHMAPDMLCQEMYELDRGRGWFGF